MRAFTACKLSYTMAHGMVYIWEPPKNHPYFHAWTACIHLQHHPKDTSINENPADLLFPRQTQSFPNPFQPFSVIQVSFSYQKNTKTCSMCSMCICNTTFQVFHKFHNPPILSHWEISWKSLTFSTGSSECCT